jgi:hypothetical protein
MTVIAMIRRAARLAVFATTFAASFCWAHDEPDKLAADEAFVLTKITGDHRRAIFEHVSGLDSFTVDSIEGPKAYKVKAGLYYLKRAEPLLMGRSAVDFPRPTSPQSTFTVVAGALNYIGDWSIRWTNYTRPSFNHGVDQKTIEKIRSNETFAKLPLYISQIGQSPVRVKIAD